MKKLCCTLILATSLAHAGEGMWTPDQLTEIAAPLKAAGLELDPAQFADLSGQPMGAIVSLGGCSASFVSPKGLVVTNHHCAYGAIQLNSTAEKNLLRDGFNAPTHADELSAGPAARVFVTREIRDVTKAVTRRLHASMSDRQRFDAIDVARKQLIAECEATPGMRCNVASFFGGVVYRLLVQMEIRDVRLVYAPPEAIGKFGGDVDNWSWPRHTGDFAFYRAYVGKDGKPADFNPDNVPYASPRFLRFAPEGLSEGDFVMLAGYPGATSRYRLADEIANVIDWTYPQQIRRFDELLAIVDAAGPAGSEVAIKYAAVKATWSNARKNFSGQLTGFAAADALGHKRSEEAALEAWLGGQGRKHADALRALAELRAHVTKGAANRERDLMLQTLNGTGLFSVARTLHRLSIERERPDERRELGFQQRDESRIEANLRQLDRRFDAGVDRALLRHAMQAYLALPATQKIAEFDAWIAAQTGADDAARVASGLDALYAGSQLGALDQRLQWFAAERSAVEASDDSFLRFAVLLAPALQRLDDQRKAHEGGLLRLLPAYMRGMLAYRQSQGKATYPDANATLRLTFGKVGGVSPRDGLQYLPFTSTAGIRAKHTGEAPFDATAEQLRLIEEGATNVTVNYLADLDVTGGNSGSATLNARGELVGLVFDMTWESVASNWVFDSALTRTIHVDQRYMQWVMREVYPAPSLLQELRLGEP